jgi:septum formation inhibitor-activating ATPase MinD
MLEVPLLGIIPEDFSVRESQVMKNAVIHTHPRSRAAKSYIESARRVLGENIPIKNPHSLGVFGYLLKSIGLN